MIHAPSHQCISRSLNCSVHSESSYRLPAQRILRVDFWNVLLGDAIGYGQLWHWPKGLGEVQLRIGGDEEDLGCGFRGDVPVNEYESKFSHELDERLRWVLRGVRNVTLVDASEEVFTRVSTAFCNAKIVCA